LLSLFRVVNLLNNLKGSVQHFFFDITVIL